MQIAPLTGLRGIAAYAVLIAHALDASVAGKGSAHFIAVGLAHFGMSLFFVLSGFVICYNYQGKLGLPGGRRKFFIARFSRLFPLYAAVTIIYAVNHETEFTAVNVVTHLTMTQSWFNTEAAYFAATWSISTEWFFYFVFAYLLAAVGLPTGRRTMIVFCSIAFAILALIFLFKAPLVSVLSNRLFLHGKSSDDIWTWFAYYSPLVRILEFILGIIAARIFMSERPVISSVAAWLAIAWCLALIFYGHEALAGTFFADFLSNFAFAPAIAVIMLYAAQSRWTALGSILSLPAMLWLGEISYSVYLLQAAGRNAALLFVSHPALDIILTCIFTTAIASLTFVFFERPSRRFLRTSLDNGMVDKLSLRRF